MGRTIALQTLVSGTLDILFAMLLTVLFGRHIGDMLRYVASGPFPAATNTGGGGAALGLAVHYGLMAIMAVIFTTWAMRNPGQLERPLLVAVIYGLITYAVMNLMVVPLRFGTPLPPKPMAIATQLFAHIALVGVPFSLIAKRAQAAFS